jgi:hypothetical protein
VGQRSLERIEALIVILRRETRSQRPAET